MKWEDLMSGIMRKYEIRSLKFKMEDGDREKMAGDTEN